MFKAKSYNKIIFSFLVIFFCYNFFVWNFFVKDVLEPPKGFISGELSRLSYKKEFKILKQNEVNLPFKHTEFSDYKSGNADVITFGDSFSNAAGGGLNPYYQDYLASNKLSVLNVHVYNKSIVEALVSFINSGFVSKIKSKYVVLEMVERNVGATLGQDYDFSQSINFEEFKRPNNQEKDINKAGLGFISQANWKFLLFQIGYLFNDKPFDSSVYITDLTKPLFSGKKTNKLLFFQDDIGNMQYNSKDRLVKANENLNKIAKMLNKQGIKFYFVVIPDKYNLYYDYIKVKKYSKSKFFEDFKSLPKEYNYINGKDILEKELAKGKKDVYFQDDTHWSNVGVQAFAKKLCEAIK